MATSPFPTPLDGVVLDVDGTLLDSNDAHANSWVDAVVEFGVQTSYEIIRPLIGVGGDKLIPAVTGLDAESDRAKALSSRRGEIFRERYLHTIRTTRGAPELVERLADDGVKLVIATSAKEEELEALLRQGGLESLIPERTSSSDAARSKPDPDIVNVALARAKLDPKRSVMVGDTPYDIEAAGRAGLSCIALRCGGWWRDDAMRTARAIFDDPQELLSVYQHLTEQPSATARR